MKQKYGRQGIYRKSPLSVYKVEFAKILQNLGEMSNEEIMKTDSFRVFKSAFYFERTGLSGIILYNLFFRAEYQRGKKLGARYFMSLDTDAGNKALEDLVRIYIARLPYRATLLVSLRKSPLILMDEEGLSKRVDNLITQLKSKGRVEEEYGKLQFKGSIIK